MIQEGNIKMHGKKTIFQYIIIISSIVCITLPWAGCQRNSNNEQDRIENALTTSMEALELTKATQARMDALEAKLERALKQMEDQGREARREAAVAREGAISARDAAERAETSALKCEKIFERSLMK